MAPCAPESQRLQSLWADRALTKGARHDTPAVTPNTKRTQRVRGIEVMRPTCYAHIAMFDAVNSIEPLYRPYYAQLPATRQTSKDAAAAAAAGLVLTKLVPEAASDIQAA